MDQPTIRVDVNSLKIVMCNCGSVHFNQVISFRILPALYSNTGKESLIQEVGAMCVKCNSVYSMEVMLKGVVDEGNKLITS